jgi:hypothetical protein
VIKYTKYTTGDIDECLEYRAKDPSDTSLSTIQGPRLELDAKWSGWASLSEQRFYAADHALACVSILELRI